MNELKSLKWIPKNKIILDILNSRRGMTIVPKNMYILIMNTEEMSIYQNLRRRREDLTNQ